MKLKYEEYKVGGYLFHIGKGDFKKAEEIVTRIRNSYYRHPAPAG
ncbi:hypothetical protein [Qiania dongpingensis]|nr:hypothetical protein [Qiania dongpingensis]